MNKEHIKRKPTIVCLCGSTRFMNEYQRLNQLFTFQGKIVLTVGVDRNDPIRLSDPIKARLDELHLRKIDLADVVFVINKDGYIGESTRNEIEYALKLGKPIQYLESE